MKPGDLIEQRYRIERQLGEGGMGAVFLARDEELGKPVAIKTLLPGAMGDLRAADQLRSEVRHAQELRHPGICAVYDFRRTGSEPFIVMEYIAGDTLNNYIYRLPGHRCDESAFTNLARQILAAVGHAHRSGVIHRDLKSANIMVTPDGSIRVMDFGIAASTKETYSRSTGRPISLSVHYASPEQIDGEKPAVSMDIYSLGCIFYEMLSGEPPFTSGDILNQHKSRQPAPISGVSETLNRAVQACLIKSPWERPQTTEEIDDLLVGKKTVRLAGAMPKADPITPREKHSPLKVSAPITSERKGGTWIKVMAAMLVILIVVFIGLWVKEGMDREQERKAWQQRQEETARQAREAQQRLTEETRRAEEAKRNMERQRSYIPPTTLPEKPALQERPVTQALRSGFGMEFVSISAGEFLMGSENGDEKPVHRVVISRGYELGKYEVTQGEWEAVMGNNPSYFNNCGSRCPVEQVSWDDIQEFLRRLNARGDGYRYDLPTEAEWEYACRAGTTGDYAGNLDEMGWYDKNSGNRTHPAGEKRANAWGLYDMHGNVWEWCSDWYGDYLSGTVTDPTGPSSGSDRVNRGGSWNNFARLCRSALRSWLTPAYRSIFLGFRLRRTNYH